jgi:hypothetical protein
LAAGAESTLPPSEKVPFFVGSGVLAISDPPLPERVLPHISEEIAAREEFHGRLGAAMAEWARIEDALLYWFMVTANLEEPMARAVFFSARSFAGRKDMLQASIEPSAMEDDVRAFLRAGLKKAHQFSGFRNRTAHGQPMFDIDTASKTYKQYFLAEGSNSQNIRQDAVTLSDLSAATCNFHELARLLYDMLPWYRAKISASPLGHLEAVRALPSEANSKAPPQKQPNS